MKLDEFVAWYQKKIGTYDKQQWEKTVEQKILSGFTSVTLKNAKLKTEFIDVDLVRGSSFPKAKPKQTLLTVIRLAIARYFLLPIYAKWWVTQTSPKLFALLLCLYVTQLLNWGIYTFHNNKSENESEHIVSLSELLIPMALSLVLSLIHSQIVATNSGNGASTKNKQTFCTNGKTRERVRRRRKVTRLRSHELTKTVSYVDLVDIGQRSTINTNVSNNGSYARLNTISSVSVDCETSKTFFSNKINLRDQQTTSYLPKEEEVNKYLTVTVTEDITKSEVQNEDFIVNSKKRNVNWDSPVHNFAQVNTVNIPSIIANKKSIGSPKTKSVRIDESVQEFYDDLVQLADNTSEGEIEKAVQRPNPILCEQTGDDDGFESLNGKSSSGEENALNVTNVENKLAIDSNLQPKNNLRHRVNSRFSLAKSTNDLSDNEMSKENSTEPIKRKCPLNSAQSFRRKYPLSSESDFERTRISQVRNSTSSLSQGDSLHKKTSTSSGRVEESSDTDEEGDDRDILSSPISSPNYNECTTSATDWLGITTNSEECSYSSELENSDFQNDDSMEHDYTPTVILNPSCGSSDRINCTIWDRHEVKKAEMSVLDISSCIIERVEAMPETCDYLYIGVAFSTLLSLIPSFCRLCEATVDMENPGEINYFEIPSLLWEKASFSFITILRFAFGKTSWERTVLIIGFAQRLVCTFLLFFLFAVAERTFKQRFLYAKLFSHLTSSRRARKSDLPHFRLNKVRNIKTWLSVRSYLKRRGPQRSVEVIVSAAFMITLLLLAFLSVEWLKDSVHLHSQFNLEALLWSSAIGIFLLRFMTLGNKINRKYRSISVLITEQINLYLQIEQKPKKKDELMVSNSVLKLAADLLKELESPFKISGLSANPYLYTTIKVVILSALSGVLSEMLGFKLKLHKIKIK